MDLKEQLIQKVLASYEIKKSEHLDNANDLQVQKKALEEYKQIIARLCKELE